MAASRRSFQTSQMRGDHDVVVFRAVLQVGPAHPARADQADLDPVVGARLSGLRQALEET